MEDVKNNIRENLIRLRKDNKLTQQGLAKKINYSDKAISRWEQGESLPDISILLVVCELFNVDFDWLIHKHQQDEKIILKEKAQTMTMKIATVCLIIASWFCVATVLFVYGLLFKSESRWTLFLWALPTSCLGLILLCRKWFNYIFNITLYSVFIWSLLLCAFFWFYPTNNIWAIFIIGIPVQGIIVLLYFIRRNKK